MLGAHCSPYLPPHPKDNLAPLSQSTPHCSGKVSLTTHPALTLTYSATPRTLDPKSSLYSVALVHVLLCKRSHKALFLIVVTSCEFPC